MFVFPLVSLVPGFGAIQDAQPVKSHSIRFLMIPSPDGSSDGKLLKHPTRWLMESSGQ
jgi:hypothetical protein